MLNLHLVQTKLQLKDKQGNPSAKGGTSRQEKKRRRRKRLQEDNKMERAAGRVVLGTMVLAALLRGMGRCALCLHEGVGEPAAEAMLF